MNNLEVIARFIKVVVMKEDIPIILETSDISHIYERYDNGEWHTIIKFRSNNDESHKLKIPGTYAEKIWEAMQAGSTYHLGPHDKLRDSVCI